MEFRKKPVVINAFLWTGDMNQTEDPEWIVEAIKNGNVIIEENKVNNEIEMSIRTLEGTMSANIGDYIIQGVKGEIYPCKPDIFEATYDDVNLKLEDIWEPIDENTSALEVAGLGCFLRVSSKAEHRTGMFYSYTLEEKEEAIKSGIPLDYYKPVVATSVSESVTWAPGVKIENGILTAIK